METLLIQVENRKAHKLLEDLENLRILKVVGRNTNVLSQKLSGKYAGRLPSDEATRLQDYVTRN